MKKIYYLPFLLSGMLAVSCSDDLGNYYYQEINEVHLSESGDFVNGETYTRIAFVDNLTFDPTIEFTQNSNESNYEYEWRLLPSGTDFKNLTEDEKERLVLCRTKKIDMPITFAPKQYTLYFVVKDKTTGVEWSNWCILLVTSVTAEGWLVLCDDNGHAMLDVIHNRDAENDIVAKDILRSDDFETGRPIRLVYSYHRYNPAILLVTDKGTYNLDRTNLTIDDSKNFKWSFGLRNEIDVTASGLAQYSKTNYWVVVDNKNDIYLNNTSDSEALFGYPVNLLDGKTRFNVAPFVGVNLNNESWKEGMSGCVPIVLYDMDNRQFVCFKNNAAYPSVMTFKTNTLFQNPTGRDMVYMESTRHGKIHALLKDPADGKIYHYGMTLKAIEIPPKYWWQDPEVIEENQQENYEEISAPEIKDAKLFAFHHLYNYMFFATGDKVYQVDLSEPDKAKEVLSFPGEEVTVLRFNPIVGWEAYKDWERARTYQLIVGTTANAKPENECGTFRLYEVPNLMGDLVKVKEHGGLGKIIHIMYKERHK